MRVGTLCYAHNRGLAHISKGLYDHGIVTDVIVIEHNGIPRNTDWYKHSQVMPIRNIDQFEVKQFIKKMDKMLYVETPFDWNFVSFAREKSYIIPMYECTPYPVPAEPHKWLCPSLLDYEVFAPNANRNSTIVPIPVDDRIIWSCRHRARHFVHNGGYLGLKGREGTTLLIDAMQYVKSPIKLTIRVQENVPEEYISKMNQDSRITYLPNNVPYEQLFSVGDVYIAPQKFNGCSLPLQEAYASGMVVMTTNRFPMNTWLPNGPLIPVTKYTRERVGGRYMEFDMAHPEPEVIAATIDAWYDRPISYLSFRGKDWGEQHTWTSLKPLYLQALQS